ncbi:MAG: Rieske 2Fe-2S domain-containing protein [Acidimicrobiales bacterium]|nr:Rieske 2Fe-2S domain-containing protein [Acidimicrobiales bacterium]
MNTSTIVILVAVGLAVLAVLFVATAGARRDRNSATSLRREARKSDRGNPLEAGDGLSGRDVERNAVLSRRGADIVPVPAEPAPVAAFVPPDEDTIAVTRRQFLNRGMGTLIGLVLGGFGAALLSFILAQLCSGFGAKIIAGKVSEILDTIASEKTPFYVAEARTWVAPYPKAALTNAKAEYQGGVLDGMEAGVVALYQKCVHLGCRVPWCGSSQWFECPCHGSKYNRVGEKTGGPAPRGMDRFNVSVNNGNLVIDTGVVVQGPPLGINTTGQQPEGPFCA